MKGQRRPAARIGVLLLLSVVALSAVSSARGRDDKQRRGPEDSRMPQFTARDIRRSYGFVCTGTNSGAAFAQLGQVSCDGIDTCTATGFMNANGVAVESKLVGKYTLDSNGLGFVTYDVSVGGMSAGVLPIQFVVMRGGREIRGLPIVPGYSVLCDLREQ